MHLGSIVADRILVVDDAPGLRKLLSDYLTDAGFEVDLAGDGDQMRREIARVVGLEVGADVYLAKPFSPRELLARLRALLRRSQVLAAPPPEGLVFGHYRLDPTARRLLKNGAD